MKKLRLNKNFIIVIGILFAVCIFIYIGKIMQADYNDHVLHGLDNDNFVMMEHAKYILENGFPRTEPFTMHEDLSFMIHDWLTCMVTYFLYSLAGTPVLRLFFYLLFLFGNFVLWRILDDISGNPVVSVLFSLFILVFEQLFVTTRPHLITFTLSACELWLLEKYNREEKLKYLALIPFISLLEINFHNPLWIIVLILMLPYIAEALLKKEWKKLKALGLGCLSCLPVAFINPYGADAVFYIFRSLSALSGKSHIVSELEYPTLENALLMFFMPLALSLAALSLSKKKLSVSHWCIYFGFMAMSFMAVRNLLFFFIGVVIVLANFFSAGTYWPQYAKAAEKGGRLMYVFITASVVIWTVITAKLPFTVEFGDNPVWCYDAVDWLEEHEDPDDIRLYNTLNDGGYLITKGFRPFIDARLEVYSEKLNGKQDILTDYLAFSEGRTYYKDFAEQYDLDTFIINTSYQPALYQMLSHSDEMRVLYEGRSAVIFRYEPEGAAESGVSEKSDGGL